LLNQEDVRGEAHIHLRGLIEKITLTPRPESEELSIDLFGGNFKNSFKGSIYER